MAYCEEYMELISASLDGALSPAEQEKLTAHLASCAECQKLFDDLNALHAALTQLPPVEVPEGLKGRILDAVAKEAGNVLPFAPATKKAPPIRWQRWLASAAVLAVVVMGTWNWKPWESRADLPRSAEAGMVSDQGAGNAAATGSLPTAPAAANPKSAPIPAPVGSPSAGEGSPAPAEAAPTAETASAPPASYTAKAAPSSVDITVQAADNGSVLSGETSDGEMVYGYPAPGGEGADAFTTQDAPGVQTSSATSGDAPAPQGAVMPRLFSAPIPHSQPTAEVPDGSGDSQPTAAPQLFSINPAAQSIPSPAGEDAPEEDAPEEDVPEGDAISRMDAVHALVNRFYDGQVEYVEVTEEEPGVRYAVGISPDAYWMGGASGVIVYVGEDEEVYCFDARNDFSDHWFGVTVNKQTGEILGLDGSIPASTPAEESPLPSPQP